MKALQEALVKVFSHLLLTNFEDTVQVLHDMVVEIPDLDTSEPAPEDGGSRQVASNMFNHECHQNFTPESALKHKNRELSTCGDEADAVTRCSTSTLHEDVLTVVPSPHRKKEFTNRIAIFFHLYESFYSLHVY